MPASTKLFTFSLDDSPTEVELLSQNTLYDLVAIGFEVCDPRNGETADDHLWRITTQKSAFAYYGPMSPKECHGDDFNDVLPDVKTTTLAKIDSALNTGMKLVLEYDYGTTTEHTFTVTGCQTITNPRMDDFPRRKTVAHPDFALFTTDKVNLDEHFSDFNHWINASKGGVEINLFQPGRKHNYGYLETGANRMIFLADKPTSLHHYLQCLNVGATLPPAGYYTWHSVVVLPTGSKKINKYNKWLKEGFCDLEVVSTVTNVPDLARVFPKVAALAGYRRDAAVKKGWIRYKNKTLLIATGHGGVSTHPKAPKGTAYDGTGHHVPSPSEILFRYNTTVRSVHELFCIVEGFLQTL